MQEVIENESRQHVNPHEFRTAVDAVLYCLEKLPCDGVVDICAVQVDNRSVFVPEIIVEGKPTGEQRGKFAGYRLRHRSYTAHTTLRPFNGLHIAIAGQLRKGWVISATDLYAKFPRLDPHAVHRAIEDMIGRGNVERMDEGLMLLIAPSIEDAAQDGLAAVLGALMPTRADLMRTSGLSARIFNKVMNKLSGIIVEEDGRYRLAMNPKDGLRDGVCTCHNGARKSIGEG